MRRLILVLTLLISQLSFGQELVDFSISSCSEKSYPELIRYRIVWKERNEDTLRLRVAVVLNCCIDPDLNVSKSNDSLFFWVNNESDMMCMCKCCFELEMEFSGVVEDSLKIMYAKEELDFTKDDFSMKFVSKELFEYPYKYVFPPPSELKAFENYQGEINQLSDDGKKIGLWKREGESHNYLSYSSRDEAGELLNWWYAAYTIEGELVHICGDDGIGESSCADAREYYGLFGAED